MKNLLFTAITLVSILSAYSQSEKEKVQATVTKSDIEGHIYFLADDLLKGRQTGSPENKIAASYLANTLRRYGVKTVPGLNSYYQPVYLENTSAPKNVLFTINGKEFTNKAILKAQKMDYSGNAVFLGFGLEEDYNGKDVRGKVVIIKGGSVASEAVRSAFGLREEKENLAKKFGAIGLVEFINTDAATWGFIDHNFNGDRMKIASKSEMEGLNDGIAYMWVQDEDGTLGKGFSSGQSVPVQIKMDAENKTPVISQNVVGMLEGSDPKLKNEFIIYSAHYDHIGIGKPTADGDSIYNGARDNAVGVTTVLSAAENIAKYPTKRSALFILFTGEEKGLLGSTFYVENPVLPLNQMVYCFNSDNAGYNDTSVATIVGMTRTGEAKNIQEAAKTFGLRAIDDPAPEQGLFDRSDNVGFAAKGIPAPTFSLGFTTFSGDVTKYYHQAGDEAQTLDYDYLLKFFEAYVLAGRLIANDPKTPQWEKGDKYEAAGNELYKH